MKAHVHVDTIFFFFLALWGSYLDVCGPELGAEFESFKDQVLLGRTHIDFGLCGAHLGLSCLQPRL